MKKIILLTFILVIFGAAYGHAQNLQLQTYFPAPYGAYDRLRLVPQPTTKVDEGLACPGLVGALAVAEPSELLFCPSDEIWTKIQGVWKQDGNYIYPTDTTDPDLLQVGIGLTTPAAGAKLHVSGGASTAKVRISSTGAQVVGLDLYQEGDQGTLRGQLQLDSSGHLYLQNPDNSNKNLRLSTGTSPFLMLKGDTNNIGLNTESPLAMLDVVKPGTSTASYLRASSSGSGGGDRLEIDNNGRTYLNTTSRPAARLFMQDTIGDVGFLRNNSGNNEDLYYNGGSDGVARFVHTGSSATGSLDFVSTASGSPVNLAQLNNAGDLYVNKKVSIGRMGLTNYDKVEFHIHEKNTGEEVVALISDFGTNTHITDSQFPYIRTDTIGAFMPQKDLTGSDINTVAGGLMAVGLSSGAEPGLNLMGVLGTGTPGSTPAIEVEGMVKLLSDQLDRMSGTDVVLGINYASDPDNDDAGTVFLANGNVGIGFDPSDPLPTTKLHVKSTLRLQPRTNKPGTCDSNMKGTIYADDSSNSLCFCAGYEPWIYLAGPGPCQ